MKEAEVEFREGRTVPQIYERTEVLARDLSTKKLCDTNHLVISTFNNLIA